MVDVPTGVRQFTRVWEQARRNQPGMLALDERWLRSQLTDLELHREGASPHYRVLYQAGDKPSGFAIYRIKMDWDAAGPKGTLRPEMRAAATAEAYAALWRHVLDVDLMARVSAEMRPVDEALRFLLADSRQPKTRIEDGVWLRMVDVPAALKGRRYAVDGRLLLRVRDAFCPWNDGQYELIGGPGGGPRISNGGAPDLPPPAAGSAAPLLGGDQFSPLVGYPAVGGRRRGA